MAKKAIIYWVVAIIVVGGLSFFGGMKYGQAKGGSAGAGGAGAAARGIQRTGTARGNFTAGATGGYVSGKILTVSGSNMTVQLQNGSSKVVIIAGSTQIMKPVTGTSADLTPGASVIVTGNADSSGSVTAQNIQIRPAGSTMPGAQGGAPAAAPGQQ